MRVLDRDGAPWFVAADVCRVLEIGNPTESLRSLDEDEKITLSNAEGNPRAGVPHQMAYISESGLYALIFKSRKPQAKAFRKWVTAEVLPAIRTHGVYALEGAIVEEERTELPTTRLQGLEQLAQPVTFPEYYQNHRPPGLDMTMPQMITFGTRVARAAKAFGVPYVQKPYHSYGMLRAYPITLCNIVARTMQKPPSDRDRDDEDFAELIEAAGPGVYTPTELRREAVNEGFFAEWLTKFSMMELSAKIRFGALTIRHDQKEFGGLRFYRKGSKNKVKFHIEEVR